MKQFFIQYKFLKIFLIAIVVSVGGNKLSAQEDFYDNNFVREIKIDFYQDNWKQILDSLFSSGDAETRIMADVTIDGSVYKACGIRYKGFSSWNADEIKNPFSINLDYTYPNQNHLGYSKLKLSNVIYDPSFIREVLSYSIARKYMPASGANFANVFIGDTLIGLYTNVEAVDDLFADKHFGTSKNAFFKGNPETLVYPFGQNANLAYTHGADSSGYMPFYQMESESGWTYLYNFIDVLNNDTANISQVLNVDRALWMHAFNYALLNLDSYIAYAQNYYLYQDDNGIFNTIPWDMNMSFGSFRHSDGATNFSGVTMEELPELNPLQHMTFSISPRPLIKNLFKNSTYRKMYLAHLRTILDENIINGEYLVIGEQLHEMVAPYVLADTNKFYSDEEFEQNIHTMTGVSTEQYPGIQEIMTLRSEYLISYPGIAGYPVYGDHEFSANPLVRNETSSVAIKVGGAENVMMFFRYSDSGQFSSLNMVDDGLYGDVVAGDSVFYAEFIPTGSSLQYYFWAENDSAGAFLPQRASKEYFTQPVRLECGDILINEILYNNYDFESLADISDIESIEIFNPDNSSILLNNLILSYHGLELQVADTLFEGRSFLTLEPDLSLMIASSQTSANDNFIKLISDNVSIVDSISPQLCSVNRSIGKFPDGSNTESVLIPTPGNFNEQPENLNGMLWLFPCPANDILYCEVFSSDCFTNIEIFNSSGNLEYIEELNGKNYVSQTIDVKDLRPAVYFLRITGTKNVYYGKFVKL